MTKRVSILGSTGSIGDSTLDLIRRANAGDMQIVALTANSNAEKLAAQAMEFGAEFVALSDSQNAAALKSALKGTKTEVGIGPESLIEAASRNADFCMAAIIGAAGLELSLIHI